MKLIWNNKPLAAIINNIEIYIASKNHPPIATQLQVVEQDTSLILEADDMIRDPGSDKPAWYLANKLEQQSLCKVGDIMVKPGHSSTLWAIVHDLDFSPSWRSEWIEMAVDNILAYCEEQAIDSIAIPVLGAQFGRLESADFIQLLFRALQKNKSTQLKRIWLVLTNEDSQSARALLKKMSQ